MRFEGLYGATGWRSAIVDASRTIRREYDGAQRMTSLIEEGPAGGTSVSRQYQYLNDVGVSRVLDLVAGREDAFQFDPFGRLKEWEHRVPGGQTLRTVSWTHDLADNVQSFADSLDGPTSVLSNVLHQMVSALPMVNSIAYDLEGRAQTKSSPTSLWSFERDALGRPQSLTHSPSGAPASSYEFTHDGQDQLVALTSPAGQSLRLEFLGDDLYAQEVGGVWQDFVYGAKEGDLLARLNGGASPMGMVKDALGNIVAIVDASGLRESYFVEPYGKPRAAGDGAVVTGSAVQNLLAFQARPYLWEAGLSLLGPREFDTSLGVFFGRDALADAMLGSPYSYAGRNPLGWHDRSGFAPESLADGTLPVQGAPVESHENGLVTGGTNSLYKILNTVLEANKDQLGITGTKYSELSVAEQWNLVKLAISETQGLLEGGALGDSQTQKAHEGLHMLNKEFNLLTQFQNGSFFTQKGIQFSTAIGGLLGIQSADVHGTLGLASDIGVTIIMNTTPSGLGGKAASLTTKAGKKLLEAGQKIAKLGSKTGKKAAAAAKGGTHAIEAALDASGKVHGKLPGAKDLGKYGVDDLARLRDELKQSVQRRIEVTVQKGATTGHNDRIAAEQQLIKSIEKHLIDR